MPKEILQYPIHRMKLLERCVYYSGLKLYRVGHFMFKKLEITFEISNGMSLNLVYALFVLFLISILRYKTLLCIFEMATVYNF